MPKDREYEVDRILGKRINSKTSTINIIAGKTEYYVKWKGYPISQSTWEPERNLLTCKDIIE